MQPHSLLKAIIGDVARGNIERIFGNIDRVDPRIGKMPARENGQTSRAGAEVEHAFHLRAILDQRTAIIAFAAKVRLQQLADVRARHDHALIDIEGQAAHVDLVDQIGGGFSG